MQKWYAKVFLYEETFLNKENQTLFKALNNDIFRVNRVYKFL